MKNNWIFLVRWLEVFQSRLSQLLGLGSSSPNDPAENQIQQAYIGGSKWIDFGNVSMKRN